jgi:ADP-ribose pyrophosphatase YjhB (NUDIX family)
MTAKPGTGPTVESVPEGDNRTRLVCPDCGYIHYDNPKVVVGAVCTWEDKILLCRRAIEPRLGFWTIPAGFLELNESTAEGAAREVWEEARAKVEMDDLIGVYDIPHISQVYVVYRAHMTTPEFAPGPESQDVVLSDWDDIPWDDIAFSSIVWALKKFRDGAGPNFAHACKEGRRP